MDDKMLIAGILKKDDTKHYLRLPHLREQRIISREGSYASNCDTDLQIFISDAAKFNRTSPLIKPAIVKKIDNKFTGVELPQILKIILSRHKYPLRQGPILPNDFMMEYEKNANAELDSMTKFIHSVHQLCAEWIPSSHLENFTSWDDMGV